MNQYSNTDSQATPPWAAYADRGEPIIFELRTSEQSALMVLDRLPTPREITELDAVGEPVVRRQSLPPDMVNQYVDPITALMLDRCLVLGPKAKTSHPAAVSGSLEVDDASLGKWSYRIVRPESHRSMPDRSYLYGAKASIKWRLPVPATTPGDDSAENSGQSARIRQRG